MKVRARSFLMSGFALVSASLIAIPSSVQPPAPAAPAIQLAADVQATAQPADYFSQLIDWWQPIFWPSASRPVPTRPPAITIPTQTSLPSTLEGAYHAIEPWVRYGFEVATYAVGWIPYVGWLSGQIMIFYNFGERIVHAITHNTLDWLNGNGSFAQNVAEGVSWTVDAFIQLGIDEWNFFLPPLPPLPFSAQVGGALNGVRDALRGTVPGVLQQLSDSLPSRDPDQPPPPPIVTAAVTPGLTTADADLAAQASSMPKAVADTLNPAAEAEDTVAATVPDVPRSPRLPWQFRKSLIAMPGNVVNDAVQALGEVRGAATETTADDSQSTVGRARGPVRAATNTATTVKNRVTDTARGVASTVKKATDDTRTSVKNATDDKKPGSPKKDGTDKN
jgi:hypothetical protein